MNLNNSTTMYSIQSNFRVFLMTLALISIIYSTNARIIQAKSQMQRTANVANLRTSVDNKQRAKRVKSEDEIAILEKLPAEIIKERAAGRRKRENDETYIKISPEFRELILKLAKEAKIYEKTHKPLPRYPVFGSPFV